MNLEYRHNMWECVDGEYYIRIPDYYFEKYKQQYFKALGIPIETPRQLREEVDRISKRQWEAFRALLQDKEFWMQRAKEDKNILVLPAPKRFPLE